MGSCLAFFLLLLLLFLLLFFILLLNKPIRPCGTNNNSKSDPQFKEIKNVQLLSHAILCESLQTSLRSPYTSYYQFSYESIGE